MPDSTLPSSLFDLNYVGEELLKVSVLLQRPVVQVQLAIILIISLSSWLIAQSIWQQFQSKFPRFCQLESSETQLSWQEYGGALIRFLTSPILVLILLSICSIFFQSQGWFSGYIVDTIKIVFDLVIFRIFIICLYALFPTKSVKYYQYRLFAPLFVLIIAIRVLGWFVNLKSLSQVYLITIFDQPLTLEPIFVTIAGLYFWFTGLTLAEKIFLKLLRIIRGEAVLIDQAISLIFRYFLIGLGLVLIAGYIGISPTAVAAIGGGLSVGIGFGLKEVISNFISGIWLLFEGSLKPGDYVRINGNMSKVVNLGIRATTFKIIKDNSKEIIPNQRFFTDNITPITGNDLLTRCSVVVGASYGCDPQAVINVILQVARQHPHVLQLPTPVAFAVNFGESSIDYELRFWIHDPMVRLTITSDLICEIWTAFSEKNIEIPFPQRDVHIK
ncbi:MAG: mechanosensitive ion channel family protein [Microcystaceae cyanobacterium]